ncbi:MAG: hypothetical protein ACJ8DY_21865, partial [Xanthobacteraceae bacterium]
MASDSIHWAPSNKSNADPAIKTSEDAMLVNATARSTFVLCPIGAAWALWPVEVRSLAGLITKAPQAPDI